VEQLSTTDWRDLVEFLHESYALRDLDGFVDHLLAHLGKLVPADVIVYNEYRFKNNRIIWKQNPPIALPGSERIWERFSHEHPILGHIRRTRDGGAVKISDFASRRQFRATQLYNEFFRPLNIDQQMHALFGAPQSLLAGLALNRRRRDFSERDRRLLNALRPHLFRAYQNARALTELLEEAAVLRRALEEVDRGVVVLSRGGGIKFMTDRARRWLDAYFGATPRRRNRLPEALGGWAAQQMRAAGEPGRTRPAAPFAVERDNARLYAELVRNGAQAMILLDVQRNFPEPAALKPLGLTNRETEVLAWMACGKTNAEIGRILASKPRTIEKHVERILQKLAVETRTAAVAAAVRAMLAPPGGKIFR